jgi:hypothetical protein
MDLSQVWASHQMDYALGHRPGMKTWVWMEGPRARALVKALRVRVLDEKTVVTAHLEHVLIHHLSLAEWSGFMASIVDDPFWDGIQAIYVPMTGHINPSMFLERGFYQTPKVFGLFNVPLDEKAILEPIRRFQMEVF